MSRENQAFTSLIYIPFLLILFLPILLFTAPSPAFADGMLTYYDPLTDQFNYADETSQNALINYEDGIQSMILTIGLNHDRPEDLFWIFPVPSEPDDVELDIFKDTPSMEGKSLSGRATMELYYMAQALQLTQIYTWPIIARMDTIYPYMIQSDYSNDTVWSDLAQLGGNDNVVIHEHIEKEGVTSELITARTADGIYDYLKNMGFHAKKGELSVLQEYTGEEYSFVVSWLGEGIRYENIDQERGVYIKFPTDKVYFPLIPTSVYGSKVVPATIRVIGHVSPVAFEELADYMRIDYFMDGVMRTREDDTAEFLNGPDWPIEYTRIKINAPSKLFTDDLWMNPEAPFKVKLGKFIVEHHTLTIFSLLIFSSVLASIFAGLLTLRGLRKKFWVLILLGLSNLFTLVAVIIATFIVRGKKLSPDDGRLLNMMAVKGYVTRRKFALLIFILAIPTLIAGICLLPYIADGASELLIHIVLWMCVLPAFLIGWALYLSLVKEEDREHFRELKTRGSSLWMMNPSDSGKLIFIPLFSLSFLIISWALVKLIEFGI